MLPPWSCSVGARLTSLPTSKIVQSFGDISIDNKRILAIEWIIEGVALIFVSVLVGLTTYIDGTSILAKTVYSSSIVLLNVLSVISLFTGSRVSHIAFKALNPTMKSAIISPERTNNLTRTIMNTRSHVLCILCSAIFSLPVAMAQQPTNSVTPPSAKTQPTVLEKHGHQRVDKYFWLNERTNPEVIDYLKAENAYTGAMMAHTKDLQEKLFEEFKTRIKQTDISVPYKEDDYFYYSRTEEGKDYPLYCRKKGSLEAPEEVMLDLNEMAKGHGFYAVGTRAVSANQNLLAFAEDTVGRRVYTLRFKNLTTGEMLPDIIPSVTPNAAWANDNKTIFYTKQDPVTLRYYRIYRHELGTDHSADKLVYEEEDETFNCYVFKTKSKKYLLIASSHTLSDEYRYLEADTPGESFTVILPRERNHEYGVDHFGDHFYIRTNYKAKNFRLVRAPVTNPSKKNWKEVIPHRGDVFLQGFEMFRDHLVVAERKNGLIQMRIRPWSGKGEHYIDFGEPAYAAYFSTNLDFNTTLLRYGYTSMTTPNSVYDYDMVTKKKILLKQDEVLGGFDQNNYQTERLYATARDGKKIPLSIVYRKGTEKNGKNPLLLYGYGSYGASQDAGFNAFRVSLLDWGFVFALAHIRGGQEMGRDWYEDGKLFKKKNTFTDFIACAEHLVKERYTSSDRLFIQGGSAGGLLIGAVVNMRPDLFKGALAAVPFVDVVTTMLDASIPLTTSEYDEWGDPNKKEDYEYMLSYSPYDNVEAKQYPNMLVTTGLHDAAVQYFEPAKWVAKLRGLKTDSNVLLLRTEMEAGHGGASARYKRYREIALQYAFLLSLIGITH